MKKYTSIVFTGDIGFDRYMAGKWTDPELVSQEIKEFLSSADHVVANVEGALIPENEAEDATGKGVFFHTMDPAAVQFLDLIRADIWNYANNHTMDAGLGGIASAISIAEKKGVRTIGAGKNVEEAKRPLILPEAGGIGLISVGFMPMCIRAEEDKAGVFGWDEMGRIAELILEVKKFCRWCVIISHGGEEFTTLPAPYTRSRYREYLEMGADIVVGHHPHVPMNYERIGDKIIFYSLGNFIFDTNYQRIQPNTDVGVLLKIRFTEDSFSFEPLGTKLIRGDEKVVKGNVPVIFENIPQEEYTRLIRMAATAFRTNERRRADFVTGGSMKYNTEEQWDVYYHDFTDPYRVQGTILDLVIWHALECAKNNGEFEKSRLEGVKAYILDQIREV